MNPPPPTSFELPKDSQLSYTEKTVTFTSPSLSQSSPGSATPLSSIVSQTAPAPAPLLWPISPALTKPSHHGQLEGHYHEKANPTLEGALNFYEPLTCNQLKTLLSNAMGSGERLSLSKSNKPELIADCLKLALRDWTKKQLETEAVKWGVKKRGTKKQLIDSIVEEFKADRKIKKKETLNRCRSDSGCAATVPRCDANNNATLDANASASAFVATKMEKITPVCPDSLQQGQQVVSQTNGGLFPQASKAVPAGVTPQPSSVPMEAKEKTPTKRKRSKDGSTKEKEPRKKSRASIQQQNQTNHQPSESMINVDGHILSMVDLIKSLGSSGTITQDQGCLAKEFQQPMAFLKIIEQLLSPCISEKREHLHSQLMPVVVESLDWLRKQEQVLVKKKLEKKVKKVKKLFQASQIPMEEFIKMLIN